MYHVSQLTSDSIWTPLTKCNAKQSDATVSSTNSRNALEEVKGHLELLDLSDNCLSSVPAQNLRGSPTLTYLDLSGNRIGDVPNLQFMNLPRLKEVRLAANRIRTVGPLAFMYVPNLQRLSLRNNSIGTLDVNRFQAFEKLEFLDLSYNDIPKVRQCGRVRDEGRDVRQSGCSSEVP